MLAWNSTHTKWIFRSMCEFCISQFAHTSSSFITKVWFWIKANSLFFFCYEHTFIVCIHGHWNWIHFRQFAIWIVVFVLCVSFSAGINIEMEINTQINKQMWPNLVVMIFKYWHKYNVWTINYPLRIFSVIMFFYFFDFLWVALEKIFVLNLLKSEISIISVVKPSIFICLLRYRSLLFLSVM